jgi:hypothetical protein
MKLLLTRTPAGFIEQSISIIGMEDQGLFASLNDPLPYAGSAHKIGGR